MCNYSDFIYEKGVSEGEARGKAKKYNMLILKSFYKRILLLMMTTGLVFGCSKKSEEAAADAKCVVQISQDGNKSAENLNSAESRVENKVEAEKPAIAAEADKELAPDETEQAVLGTPILRTYKAISPKISGIETNPLLADIPGNSFFILASAAEFDLNRPDVEDFFQHISTLVMAEIKQIEADTSLEKATMALLQGVFRTFSPQKLKSLGLSGEKNVHFALYFARQTPVIKVWMADPEKFRQIVESYWMQNDVSTRVPTDIAAPWTLVELSSESDNELALHWGASNLTMTIVSDSEHAGLHLPELLVPPAAKQSALVQLSKQSYASSAAVVGMLDLNQALNNLVALQAQIKKFQDTEDDLISKACIKDARRIATLIPVIQIEVLPVSGGNVLGFEAKFSLKPKANTWLDPILAYRPMGLNLPKTEHAPLAQVWASLPAEQLITALETLQDNIKRDPFTCPELAMFNDIGLPEEPDIISQPQIVLNSHQFAGILYEQKDKTPSKFALAYHSAQAAETAYRNALIQSEQLKSQFEPKPEDMNTDLPKAEDVNPDTKNTQDIADSAEVPVADRPMVYTDVQIAPDLDLPKNLKYHVETDKILLATDDSLIERLGKSVLKPSTSIFHVEVSERLLEEYDKDPKRYYRLGVDLSTSPQTIDLTLQYVIE